MPSPVLALAPGMFQDLSGFFEAHSLCLTGAEFNLYAAQSLCLGRGICAVGHAQKPSYDDCC